MIFLQKDDADKVLEELHDELAGGHFGGEMAIHKVLRARYYWPTLLKDAHAFARIRQVLKVNVGKARRHTFPL